MGAHYRHTTPAMAARVVDAIQQRLMIVLDTAEQSISRDFENAESLLEVIRAPVQRAPSSDPGAELAPPHVRT